ncbi:MAG: drug/metabolite transporter superfamily protein YnfA [Verrucomicrobiales bacterium]|jgi:drug/metabolite transporter superfamily protein YnfA
MQHRHVKVGERVVVAFVEAEMLPVFVLMATMRGGTAGPVLAPHTGVIASSIGRAMVAPAARRKLRSGKLR